MSDELVFSDEPTEPQRAPALPPWQVLIVDDEPAVHEVTQLVMSDFVMDSRPLQFSHCYSGAQAREFLAQRNDIALILLDVVMESDHAGLDLVQHIRDVMKNLTVRIVLRTGQPGQAPEEQVIRDYDINDYKEKTDLTRRKLITVFCAGLRAYRDLTRLENATQGLRRSIDAIGHVYETHNLRSFASAVLDQVNFLFDMRAQGLCASRPPAYAAQAAHGHIKVLAATQAYSGLLVDEQIGNLPPHVQDALQRTLHDKSSHFGQHYYAGYFLTKTASESVIYLDFVEPPSATAREMLEIFSANVAITYDGLLLLEETQEGQAVTVALLGGSIEKQFKQPDLHLKRMSQVAALLAQLSGFDERETELMRAASALHDIGKTRISDALLTKHGPLHGDEWIAMKAHTLHGHALLSTSRHAVHAMAAHIARDHHEHWDGQGYPQGLVGEAITQVGRIAALADVLDSMTHSKCYGAAHSFEEAAQFIQAHCASRFDPALVAIFRANLAEFGKIYQN